MRLLVDPVGDIGGAELLMKDIVHILGELKDEYNLTLICSLYCNRCKCEYCDETINMMPLIRLAKKLRLYDNTVFLKTAYLKKFLNNNIDLLLTHNFFIPSAIHSKTHIIAIGGRDWKKFYDNVNPVYKVYTFFPYFYRINFLKQSDMILVFNPFSAQWFRNVAGEDKVKLLRTGILVKNYPRQVKPPAYDFIFVGRFSFEKNPEIVINTFLGTEFRGLMIGGPRREVLGNIEIEPFQPRRLVIQKMQKARIGIISSRFEAFPLVLLEYLVMGIPVIKSDSFFTPLDKYTAQFRCCDPESLKETFEEVFENYNHYKRLSEKARKVILKHYNLERNFKKLFVSFIRQFL